MLIVGLTGGICSGKTTVSNYFEQLFDDISIIDADIITRGLLDSDPDIFNALLHRFGNSVINPENNLINREHLRRSIFSNSKDKLWLEALLHPKIYTAINTSIQQFKENDSYAYCLLIAPLLIESGLNTLCDRILVIDINEEIQIARITGRYKEKITEKEINTILASQLSRSERLKFAHNIINNNHSLEGLPDKILELDSLYRVFCVKNKQ